MRELVNLVGLDFGTTTSSAVVASARLVHSAVTGRMELSGVEQRFRSEMIFTPLDELHRLDIARVEQYLDAWLAAGQVRGDEIFGGGALLTGLTAQKENAAVLVQLIRRRLGSALIATADDPCLESWLAFMGSCAGLSRADPNLAILNLDIGGGTSNLALGMGGEVLRTGCLYVGARHVQVAPGGYEIVKVSRYAREIFEALKIRTCEGESLTFGERQAILDFYLAMLELAVFGQVRSTEMIEPLHRLAEMHVQVPYRRPPEIKELAITFSGGVGELIYQYLADGNWPPTTCFGDLGIDLAQRIESSPVWQPYVQSLRPASAGRATVYGLLRHSTEVSGSTLYLPSPQVLPWTNLPILGTLNNDSSAADVASLLDLARRSSVGGCVRIQLAAPDAASVAAIGKQLGATMRTITFPPAHPLLLFVNENVGMTLGNYVTEWGAFPLNLIVIDEIPPRDAQFAHLGAPRGQVVPVSFYGLNETAERLWPLPKRSLP